MVKMHTNAHALRYKPVSGSQWFANSREMPRELKRAQELKWTRMSLKFTEMKRQRLILIQKNMHNYLYLVTAMAIK